MATIILDYNTRNVHAQKALDYILSSEIFKVQAIGKSSKKTTWSDKVQNDNFSYLISEQVLAKDWLNEEEDEVWKNL